MPISSINMSQMPARIRQTSEYLERYAGGLHFEREAKAARDGQIITALKTPKGTTAAINAENGVMEMAYAFGKTVEESLTNLIESINGKIVSHDKFGSFCNFKLPRF